MHRLGQKKEVFIERLLINNTVEQRVQEIQQRKQGLSDGALGEGTGQRMRLSVGELAHCEYIQYSTQLFLIRFSSVWSWAWSEPGIVSRCGKLADLAYTWTLRSILDCCCYSSYQYCVLYSLFPDFIL